MTDHYYCPDCRQSMSTSFKLSAPPTHPCPQHKNKTRVMPKVEDTKKKPPTE